MFAELLVIFECVVKVLRLVGENFLKTEYIKVEIFHKDDYIVFAVCPCVGSAFVAC